MADARPATKCWRHHSQGERLLNNALEAIELRNKTFDGQGTARTLAPASTFTLTQHPVHDAGSEEDKRFAVLAVHHSARNNLDEDLKRAADAQLGPVEQASADATDATTGNAEGDIPHYRNRFTAVRAAIPYRPLTLDGQGRAIHPKPTIAGSQSAIVIGAGEVIHTDRDHRIKVQFHWQRGADASMGAAEALTAVVASGVAAVGWWLLVGGVVLTLIAAAAERSEMQRWASRGYFGKEKDKAKRYKGRGEESLNFEFVMFRAYQRWLLRRKPRAWPKSTRRHPPCPWAIRWATPWAAGV